MDAAKLALSARPSIIVSSSELPIIRQAHHLQPLGSGPCPHAGVTSEHLHSAGELENVLGDLKVVVQSTTNGQDSYALPTLFNVRADGTVYYTGSPCMESPPDSCGSVYWRLVQLQHLASATAPAPTTPSASAATPTDCGRLRVRGATADPSSYTDITATGVSCATARTLATSFSLGPDPPVSTAGEGFTCGPPAPDSGQSDGSAQLVGQCEKGSARVEMYSNSGG